MKIWITHAERLRLQSEQAAADHEQARRMNYRRTFATPEGQAVLADICQRAGLMSVSFAAGQPDLMAFKEGQRAVSLMIIETLASDPSAALRLVQTGDIESLFNHG